EREVYAALAGDVPVLGSVRLLAEAAAGRARPLRSGDFAEETIAGGRIGLGVSTRLGPVAVAWGRNDAGGSQWVVRVGEWF
ncbi:MAG TPA: hypothetical protein VJ773_09610, partial [Gemmatimonadales bacterium]|nr:hypothetical protein [Gemmatimonadales bacterium]